MSFSLSLCLSLSLILTELFTTKAWQAKEGIVDLESLSVAANFPFLFFYYHWEVPVSHQHCSDWDYETMHFDSSPPEPVCHTGMQETAQQSITPDTWGMPESPPHSNYKTLPLTVKVTKYWISDCYPNLANSKKVKEKSHLTHWMFDY